MATATKVNLFSLAAAPSETELENAARTHRMIREHLESDPTLAKYRIQTYLQGSYKNSTNVRGDSDVDMGSKTSDIYNPDVSRLPTESPSPYAKSERMRFDEAFTAATYTFWDYRRDVLSSLQRKYGYETVIDNNKAIKVVGNTSRLDADVLACIEHRRYWRFHDYDRQYHSGICFYSKRDPHKPVVNFPQQHYENLTNKNTACDGKLKGSIRVLKRIRNSMVESGQWRRERSPSYYLECLLWNAPTHLFKDNYERVMFDVLKFLHADLTEKKGTEGLLSYTQANGLFVLFHPDSWNVDDALQFIEMVWGFAFEG
jgi:hypothetical protein